MGSIQNQNVIPLHPFKTDIDRWKWSQKNKGNRDRALIQNQFKNKNKTERNDVIIYQRATSLGESVSSSPLILDHPHCEDHGSILKVSNTSHTSTYPSAFLKINTRNHIKSASATAIKNAKIIQ